jgi:ABC-type antimicrobial peptide transport system permease subunit
MTVIGVAGNVLSDRIEGPPMPMLYRPTTQGTNLSFAIAVRTSGDPERLAGAVERAVRGADPNLPVFAVRTLDDLVGAATAPRRFPAQLLGGFALAALLLAAIGIYGVMSYLVTQRTREIGIRMALGARPVSVVGLITSHALLLAAAGILIGVGAALGAARIFNDSTAGLFYNVRPGDPATLIVVGALLAATAIAATLVPARRAARVDPMIALRAD